MKSLLRSILFFLFTLLGLPLWAQDDEFRVPDSLVAKLREFRKTDNARAEALDACLQFYNDNNRIVEAAIYINELKNLANDLNDVYWIAQSKYYQGVYALYKYETSSALKLLNEALKTAETLRENNRSQLLLAKIYLAQSAGFEHLNLNSEAYEQIEKGLEITEKNGFVEIQKTLINNKAGILYSLRRYDEALLLQKNLYGDGLESKWLMNLATVYCDLNNYDTAFILIDSVLLLAKNNDEKSDILSVKSFILNNLEKWDESALCLKEMQDLVLLNKSKQAVLFMRWGEVYCGKKQYSEAIQALDSAIYCAKSIKRIDLECFCLKKKAIALSRLGDFHSAFDNLNEYLDRFDTITKRNNEEKILAVKYQQEYDMMEQQYESEQALLQLRQKFIIIIASILVVVAVGFAFIVWKNKKRKEAFLKTELDHRNREITSKTLNQNQLNETLDGVIQDLTHLMNNPRGNENTLPSAIHKLKGLLDDGSKKEFDYYFVEVHPDFYTKLKADFPKLTQNELRLCALIKANLNIKDIANLNNVSIDSVKSSRKRLRKSLGISDPKIDLAEFLSKY